MTRSGTGNDYAGNATVPSNVKISILTPSYNSVDYIQRAIESVLAQEYSNWEHIIMDGGSTDGTVELLKKHPHLIWTSAPDKGQSDAMNKAFAKSSGELILYLNADDEIEPGFLASAAAEFKKMPQLELLIGNLRMNIKGNCLIKNPSTSLVTILDYWPGKFPLNPVSYIYKRSLQNLIGPFPSDNHYTMDYWFLLRAYLRSRVVKTEVIGGTFYLDGNNKTADLDRAKESLRKVRNTFLMRYFFTKPVLKFVLIKLTKRVIR